MKNRAIFANTINSLGKSINLSANECETFGMTWGCKSDCPVFSEGDCQDSYFDNILMFSENEDVDEFVSLYKNKLTKEQLDKIKFINKNK